MTASRRLRIPESMAGERLDRGLAQLCPDLSKARLQKLVRKGELTLDGKRVVRTNGVVRGGEAVTLRGVGPPPLEVLYQGPELIAVVKPAGVLSHSIAGRNDDSISTRAVAQFGELPTLKGPERPGVVHRLDRDTSGVMALARTDRAMLSLEEQFRDRSVEKTYLALVSGNLPGTEFEVDLPIEAPRDGADRQQVARPGSGKEAFTAFRQLESAAPFSLLECRPRTGRRHQIRVHLFSQGLQLLGEELYRVPENPKPGQRIARMCLHAAALTVELPGESVRKTFECDLPEDMHSVLRGLLRG